MNIETLVQFAEIDKRSLVHLFAPKFVVAVFCSFVFMGCTKGPNEVASEHTSREACYCYTLSAGDANLDSAVINQIDPQAPYYHAGPYLYFGKSSDTSSPNPFTRSIDIVVDSMLTNRFTIVLTIHKSKKIVGSIRQTEATSSPAVTIPRSDIARLLRMGRYDLYLFRNGRLMVKDVYAFI